MVITYNRDKLSGKTYAYEEQRRERIALEREKDVIDYEVRVIKKRHYFGICQYRD